MTALLEEKTQSGAKLRPMRLTGAMFDRMLEVGVLKEGVRVELLDGQLFEKEDIKQAHANRIKNLYDRLQHLFSSRADVYAQSPVQLPQDGRSLPDVFMVKQGAGASETPTPEDVYLLIEVADSSVEKDRDLKSKL